MAAARSVRPPARMPSWYRDRMATSRIPLALRSCCSNSRHSSKFMALSAHPELSRGTMQKRMKVAIWIVLTLAMGTYYVLVPYGFPWPAWHYWHREAWQKPDYIKEMRMVAESRHLHYQIVRTGEGSSERAFLARLCTSECSVYGANEDDGTGGNWGAFGATQEAAVHLLNHFERKPMLQPQFPK